MAPHLPPPHLYVVLGLLRQCDAQLNDTLERDTANQSQLQLNNSNE